MPDPSLSTPSPLIRRAYDMDFWRDSADVFTEKLSGHLRRAMEREGPVLPWRHPSENVEAAAAELDGASDDPERFSALLDQMLSQTHNLHHPGYIGHQVPPPVPLAGLFDAVGAVTNQPMAVYEMGPWATAVEQAMVRRLGEMLGLPEGFSGIATQGGSLANLTALLTARNVSLAEVWERGIARAGSGSDAAVLVVQSDAHYSVSRSAGILGIGTENIVKVPLDDRRRMRPEALETELVRLKSRRRRVMAVVACAGGTLTGAFDPLEPIGEICRRHGVWLHVDAAHGGSAAMSEKHRHLLRGIDRADSVVWDAHKMLYVSALCAFVFYRRGNHQYATFQQDASYLFDPTAPYLAEYDVGLKTVECTKRAAVYGLWGVWSLFGKRLFEELIDRTYALGRAFHETLIAADDFAPLNEPECNILVFRHVPRQLRDTSDERLGRFQLELRRRLVESGRFYIVSTTIDGVGALRAVIMNPLITPDDLTRLIDALRQTGTEILSRW